jgi:hypothetical protein
VAGELPCAGAKKLFTTFNRHVSSHATSNGDWASGVDSNGNGLSNFMEGVAKRGRKLDLLTGIVKREKLSLTKKEETHCCEGGKLYLNNSAMALIP